MDDTWSKRIITLQYLRAFAAVLVVYHHVFTTRIASDFKSSNYGELGVDLFFIISGFVMWLTTESKRQTVQRFFINRFVRIVPLWWIALTVWVVVRYIRPDRLGGADVTFASMWASYLLLPHYHAVFTDRIWPILVPGWTLQFEMFFYFIFGMFLLVKRRTNRFWGLNLTLASIVGLGHYFKPVSATLRLYSDPLLLEFLGGVWLAYFRDTLLKISPLAASLIFALVVLASIELSTLGLPEGWRLVTSGVPSLILVGSALSLELVARRHVFHSIDVIGSASYSLYLFHGTVLAVIAAVWAATIGVIDSARLAMAFAAISTSVAVVIAVIIYFLVESPLLTYFKRLLFRFRAGAG